MDKVNEMSFHPSAEHRCPDQPAGRVYFDSPLFIKDRRIAQLSVLLQQIQELVGLEVLPKPELLEIVSNAVQLCGFVNPNEIQAVIVTVLDAFEMQRATPESP